MRLFTRTKTLILALVLVLSVSTLVGCGRSEEESNNSGTALSGTIEIDGSSTVFPITAAMGEEFQNLNRDVKVTIGVSGTGGGFKRFITGDTDISNASRHIKDSEAQKAKENNIDYSELSVAIDGIAVIVNPQNDWATNLTVEDLNKIWAANGGVTKWSDINPDWPSEEINLYGPGTDSGTFDYFTEVILGDEEIRTDFIASEDDNVLVQGVSGDKNALGYFGYAYYIENKDNLNLVSINGVEPNDETIASGEYSPLSRPIFIYVNHESYNNKAQVKEFVNFYFENAVDIVPEIGYIPLSHDQYEEELNKLK